MKTYKAIFTGSIFSKEEIKILKNKGVNVFPQKTDLSEKEIVKLLKGVDIYILGGDDVATEKVIKEAKDLKLIAFLGAGYERYVNIQEAKRRNIPVTYTPHANAATVAEHSVALILDAVKQITYLNNMTKRGNWEKREAWNLEGKTLGVVGMGAVGSKIAKILHNGFNMKVIYVSRTRKGEIEKELKAEMVNLGTLLKKSDVVSLNAIFSNETVGMIGEEQFNLMKPTSVLINSASAEIVKADSLYKALNDNKIACAAFDVYYKEPISIPDDFKLLSLPDNKFIITPHTSYSSKEALQGMSKMLLESISDFIDGKEIRHLTP